MSIHELNVPKLLVLFSLLLFFSQAPALKYNYKNTYCRLRRLSLLYMNFLVLLLKEEKKKISTTTIKIKGLYER